MLQSLYRKVQSLWKAPENLIMSDNFVRQALPMKYVDNDALEKELNRILGENGWRVSEVCALSAVDQCLVTKVV